MCTFPIAKLEPGPILKFQSLNSRINIKILEHLFGYLYWGFPEYLFQNNFMKEIFKDFLFIVSVRIMKYQLEICMILNDLS